jgi:hypothetical protein
VRGTSICVALLFAASLAACSSAPTPAQKIDAPSPPDWAAGPTEAPAPTGALDPTVASAVDDSITFRIDSTGPLQEVTYGTLSGIRQIAAPASPWTVTIPRPPGVGIYTLLAQLAGDGSVTCTISSNGNALSTNTSTGKFTVVTCNGQTR